MSRFNPIHININSVCCTGNPRLNDRYSLEFKLNNRGKSKKRVIVIMKNPSSTGKSNIFYQTPPNHLTDVDKTTTHVIAFLYQLGYKNVTILNLFPYMSSSPKDLNFIYQNIQNNPSYLQNIATIQSVLTTAKNNSDDIILAWGQKSNMSKKILDQAIDVVLQLLNGVNRVYEVSNHSLKPLNMSSPIQRIYPLHGSQW